MVEVKAKVHRPFEITLGSHLTSGYEWRPVFNQTVLKLLEKRRSSNMHKFGASGKEVFRFEPLRSGDYDILFELVRPFENTSVECREFSLHVD
jgi:predicted secreted protein